MQEKMTLCEMSRLIRNKERSPREVLQETLATIRKEDGVIHAFLCLSEEKALQRAKELEDRMMRGEKVGSLVGLPVAIKDNCCTKGITTTCGSRMLLDFVPDYTATAVERLENAGAIVVGKTNMDEFAMGSTTETSAFGVTRNPRDVARVPGGSSGGSAAAVASGEVLGAIGSDTGGSIRQPASHCGVVGIKPTYGRVSRRGLIAYASSLDQIGPVAGNVSDCTMLLDALCGWDAGDSTSVKMPEQTSFFASLSEGVKGLRIGIPREWLESQLEAGVYQSVLLAAQTLETQGAVVELCSLPEMEYAVPAYYVIACGEAASNLARFDGIRYGHRTTSYENLQEMYCKTRSEGFGTEVKRRILCGNFMLSAGYYDAYYRRAMQTRRRISASFAKAFATYDVLLAPVAPTTAPLLGESLSTPLKMYEQDAFTVAASLAGLPAMSVPCGFSTVSGVDLPVGIQLIGDLWQERKMLRVACAIERRG